MAGTFALDLTRLCKKAKVDVQTVVRKVAFEAFRRVVLRTPVDTGRARANWGVRVGQPNTAFTTAGSVNKKGKESFDKGGGQSIRAAQEGVEAWNCNGSIFMTNNLPYIGALEYGHSKQAANGMVRVTVEEMTAWARSAANTKATLSSIKDRTE